MNELAEDIVRLFEKHGEPFACMLLPQLRDPLRMRSFWAAKEAELQAALDAKSAGPA